MNMWKRLSPVKKEIFLLLIMAGFGLVKQFLVYNLPIMAVHMYLLKELLPLSFGPENLGKTAVEKEDEIP